MNKIIEVKNAAFEYSDGEKKKSVIKDMSVSFEKGSFTVILGHNGSGKSTLAKLLNGLYKPDSGDVFVDGFNTRDEKKEIEIKRRVGMVFQNPDNQLVATIVEEDVAFGPENLGIEPKEIRRRVDESLDRVGMSEYKRHAPHLLSGGQKQRVAIAGVLAMQPECIVFDEPTAMLDPSGRKDVMNSIKQLNKEYGITIVLITHYMDEAAQGDRIVVVDDGKIIIEGAPKKVFSEVEKMKKIGLDVPQVTELAYELNKSGINISTEILNVDEMVDALCQLK